MGIAAVVALGLALGLRRPQPGVQLHDAPAEVLGRWTTRDARFEGRALVVTPDSVTLFVGAGQPPRPGRILSIRTWEEGLVRVLRIEYDAGDGPETMDLLLTGHDAMRLRHPREVLWTRAR